MQKWWRAKLRLIEEVEEYRRELKGGTQMRGGSFAEMMKKESPGQKENGK